MRRSNDDERFCPNCLCEFRHKETLVLIPGPACVRQLLFCSAHCVANWFYGESESGRASFRLERLLRKEKAA